MAKSRGHVIDSTVCLDLAAPLLSHAVGVTAVEYDAEVQVARVIIDGVCRVSVADGVERYREP